MQTRRTVLKALAMSFMASLTPVPTLADSGNLGPSPKGDGRQFRILKHRVGRHNPHFDFTFPPRR